MTTSQRDREHIFERLRSGVVPERGLDAFAVGIERQRAEIGRLLDLAGSGEGVFKFLRGGYGCGKTFMARLALLDAQAKGFATSFVVVSDNDLHFYKFDHVYRKVVQELGTNVCPRGALGDIIDRWIAKVEDALIDGGADPDAADFDRKVKKRIEEDITSLTGGKAPEDLGRVLREVFSLKQAGKVREAGALLSWLSGSENVGAAEKRAAGLKGEISSRDAMDYLHGILEVVKAAGYKGLVIVIDEAETILRMRQDVRGKSLNGIRQIIDAADRYKGLFWVFTGTPEFFDVRRGVAGLQPLHDRIQFLNEGGLVTMRQPQLELRPFDRDRLKDVALRLRSLYPAPDPNVVASKVTPERIAALVDEVTAGFKGDVGVVPRQFLRRFVNLLDTVAENPDAALPEPSPTVEEQRAAEGKKPIEYEPEPEDEKGYSATSVEF
ncbi:BREX system ATP-binding protein BrxD [Polyangium sorediatum]|uniref:BREX system ATP-binding protein BrxD n=1 Tax=Polyangium sorediatum TaxID=889274 RepID=A0ABT6P2V3_9BACT|nr:BREX system ATP-binding protein BrxD [Polyangium sorediatum]MDI1434932.1 BREX system ATP-binding protein BrxD [Polyangium sorediatum]